ncbi:hypothetical protein KQ757_15505, partial [Listeria monocytogenes]|nr:hypothetical protein [Listeria monocytogenes]
PIMRDPAAPLNRSASLPGRIPTEKGERAPGNIQTCLSNIPAPIPAWNPQRKLHDLHLSGTAYKVRLFLSLIGREATLRPVDFLN